MDFLHLLLHSGKSKGKLPPIISCLHVVDICMKRHQHCLSLSSLCTTECTLMKAALNYLPHQTYNFTWFVHMKTFVYDFVLESIKWKISCHEFIIINFLKVFPITTTTTTTLEFMNIIVFIRKTMKFS